MAEDELRDVVQTTGSSSNCKPSEPSGESSSEEELVSKVVLVGDDTHHLEPVAKKVKGVEHVVLSETGLDLVKDASECEMTFVVTCFEGEIFDKLRRAQVRIVGPTLLKKYAKEDKSLPLNIRPLYCMSMQHQIVCFTGFRQMTRMKWLVDHVHFMGGSVRKDEGMRITHMVASVTHGTKYRFAVNMGKPIMSKAWIEQLWLDRDKEDVHATDEAMNVYRMKPFYECCLSFLGFDETEQRHMEELTTENGGTFAAVGDQNTTHLIIDVQSVKTVPSDITLPPHVVRGEWFWGCIQMTACADEKIYLFEQMTPARARNTTSFTKNRKRKRLQELAAETEGSPFMAYKRRSSSNTTDVSATSMSPESFLDLTYTPDKSDTHLTELKLDNNKDKNTPTPTKMSKRRMVVQELLQTEQNYVGILHTILHTFKEEIEKPDQYSGAILAAQDIKIIFGNIPAIYEAHCKLRDSLSSMLDHWSETNSVGDCLLARTDELMKAYPPFVNFFENTKETILKCDSSNPRFHAFLKLCMSKPECGRQSLQELLIRPVQRLPSIVLLLQDILKRTDASNPDKGKLELAIEKVKEIMNHVNEDKRKTERQVVMFDIVNDIDSCPATLLSSNRHFVMKADVMELSGNLSSRGDPLTLFVFSDSVEICKRRIKVLNSTNRSSPAATVHMSQSKSLQKAYKHLEILPMSSIKRVLDVEEDDDCRLAFGLIYRNSHQIDERLYSFTLAMDNMAKEELLNTICTNLAIALCRPDIGTFLAQVRGDELNITTKDLHKSKAHKFGRRVSRAFSFKATPSKLKRAVSGMVHGLSPFVRESGKLNRGDIRKLASTLDLNETVEYDSDTLSIGGFSLQEDSSAAGSILGSPVRQMFTTPSRQPTSNGSCSGSCATLSATPAEPSSSKNSHTLFATPTRSAAKAKSASKWATFGPSSASKAKKYL